MPHPFAEEVLRKMEAYAEQWKHNAAGFSANGDYSWMASFVRDHKKILEVGTGDGTALLALLRDGHQVLSLDLNPWCLAAAEKLVRTNGFAVSYRHRAQEVVVDPDGWGVRYGAMPAIDAQADAILLLTDVLADDALPPMLESMAPFDAICWWCPGAYGYRAGLEDEDKKRYRFQMRRALCHTAQQLLRSGGILHVVDRSVTSMPTDMHRSSLIDAHSDAAARTSIAVDQIDFRPVDSLSTLGGIPMPHEHLPGGESGKLALISVRMRKP